MCVYVCLFVVCFFFWISDTAKQTRFRIATVGGGKEKGRVALLNYAMHPPPPQSWDCKLLDHAAPNEVLVPGEVSTNLSVS